MNLPQTPSFKDALEAVLEEAKKPNARIALVSSTRDFCREMVEGICQADKSVDYKSSRLTVSWPNGALASMYVEGTNALRGPIFTLAWLHEHRKSETLLSVDLCGRPRIVLSFNTHGYEDLCPRCVAILKARLVDTGEPF